MKSEGDFENNMNQLIHLLKKILTSRPPHGQWDLASLLKGQGINLNLCFFTFLPVTEEEMDEIEEIYEQYLFDEENGPEALDPELSPADLDFLRRNGIQF